MRSGSTQFLLIHARKTVNPPFGKKELESANSRSSQWFKVRGIMLGNATPRPPVDSALAARRSTLGLESSNRRRCRQTIQRHIDQRSKATGSCGPRDRPTPPPPGPARLIDVSVRVHKSGKQNIAAAIDYRGVGWYLARI